ncbi:hypothetical protein DDW09_04240 [Sulfolobus sp. SCGC AB-777_L09]|nr:hypothetical protein DDW09_04240 [Sulfolobus sp. SCGC AB-777_L09]
MIYVKGNELNIVEKNGKFTIVVLVSENKVNVDIRTSNVLLRETLKLRLEKNFGKYKDIVKVVKDEKPSKSKRVVFMKSVGDYILDLRGLVSPVPEIEVKKKLIELRIGESLEVLVDNPAAVEITFPEVAKLFRCRYEVFNMGDYVSFVFYKLSTTPTRTEYVEAIENKDLKKIKEYFREGEFRALLYFYFSKIEKSITSNGIRRDQLKKDVLGLITAAPIR